MYVRISEKGYSRYVVNMLACFQSLGKILVATKNRVHMFNTLIGRFANLESFDSILLRHTTAGIHGMNVLSVTVQSLCENLGQIQLNLTDPGTSDTVG